MRTRLAPTELSALEGPISPERHEVEGVVEEAANRVRSSPEISGQLDRGGQRLELGV